MAGMVTATLDIASGRTITVELTPSHTDAKPADYSYADDVDSYDSTW